MSVFGESNSARKSDGSKPPSVVIATKEEVRFTRGSPPGERCKYLRHPQDCDLCDNDRGLVLLLAHVRAPQEVADHGCRLSRPMFAEARANAPLGSRAAAQRCQVGQWHRALH